MAFNTEYINIKYSLIDLLLINANKELLDVSYSIDGKDFRIQIVLLNGFDISEDIIENIKRSFGKFNVTINVIHLTKEKFNENKGEWNPKYYQWLNYLLFSKAEA